jgi:DNA invertase Pin-like site-specific DNA recombinase
MKIGYARVSSAGQSARGTDRGARGRRLREDLSGEGERRIHRPPVRAREALDQLRPGDELVVTRLDRLARSVPDLYTILQKIAAAGASFAALHQSGIDTDTPTGKLMLGILGVIAEFERDLIRERQAEGIARAKAAGIYRGKNKRKLDPAKVLEAYREHGDGAFKVLGCARSSVYRIVQEHALKEAEAAEAAAPPGEGIQRLIGDPAGAV